MGKHKSKSCRSDEDRSDKYKKSKRQRHAKSGHKPSHQSPRPQELLIAASVGDLQKSKSLIRRGADVEFTDATFTTPLIAASRLGHLDVVKYLLRHDANAAAQDLSGNTAAHYAALNGHLEVLSALLLSKTIGSLQEPNDKGQTIEQLAAAAMTQQDQKAAFLAQQRQPRSFRNTSDSEDSLDEEHKWQEKLKREMSPDEFGAYYGNDWHADEYETAEEYAARIYQEMEEKKARKERFDEAVRKSKKEKEEQDAEKRVEEDAEAQKRAKAAAAEPGAQADAAAREMQSNWRAAVAAGSAGTKLASYEARWEFFCTKNGSKIVRFSDVPWILLRKVPNDHQNITAAELAEILFHNADSFAQKRQVLRRELIRWHPDKFIAKFGAVLDTEDRDMILQAVTGMSQHLTTLLKDLSE